MSPAEDPPPRRPFPDPRPCAPGWNGRIRKWSAPRWTTGTRWARRNWGNSQRERSWLVGTFDSSDPNLRRAEFLLEQRFKIGAGARPAAEEIQAQRTIFEKRLT